MNLITHSRLATYRRCPREHYYRYVLGYVPAAKAPALAFGTLVHAGLEAWWRGTPGQRWPAVQAALQAGTQDPYEYARAAALLAGYDCVYGAEGWTPVAVEEEWRAPVPDLPGGLLDPEQPWMAGGGVDLRGWQLAGKWDAIAWRGCETVVVEHKTSSMPLDSGGAYWQRLQQDGQISLYLAGAKAAGYDVSCVVYDVLGTASLEPLLATPEAERRYTKDGRLYARQRAQDETPEAYQQRLIAAVAAEPRRYYARADVVRLQSEEAEHRAELRQWIARLVSDVQRGRAPKNPEACMRYGRLCEYAGVCGGSASLESSQFERLEFPHPELQKEE